MSSDIQIINMALGHLGQKPVSTLDKNTIGDAGRKMLVFQDMARDMVLADHDWLEARQPIRLNPLTVSGYNPYTCIYALPTDFIRMSAMDGGGAWYVGTFLPDGEGRARMRVIYAQQPIRCAHMIVRLPWDQMSPGLALATSLRMAELACTSVTGERSLRQGLMTDLEDVMMRLKTAETANGDDDTDWQGGLQDMRRLAL